jgi:hypothetical protein
MAERRRSRVRTLEAREQELTSHAYDLAERQILEGTASSQVVTHFLKMGSTRELVEQERLRGQIEVDRVKAEQLEGQKRIEELYVNAIEAMGIYNPNAGQLPPGDD